MTQNQINDYLYKIGTNAKKASVSVSKKKTGEKNQALKKISEKLIENTDKILASNADDLKKARENGMSEAMLDRLALSKERINSIASAVLDVISLPDPVGKVLSGYTSENGMKIEQVSVPLGVIAMIYEARPNVTADAAVLCLKSGNAVILKGGKEAFNSNKAITDSMREALAEAGFDKNAVQLIDNNNHEVTASLMRLNEFVDVLIPRGSARLIKAVVENASVPVIETGAGNCHIYVDKNADINMAANIIFNAKTSRPSVCNACESLVIHKNIINKALPVIKKKLDEKNVIIYGDETSCAVTDGILPASDDDWGTEYLDYKISVKTVNDIDEAIAHIAKYSTGHSECIVTKDYSAAEKFLNEVNSAAVYVNASTRFTDGGEFGLGAEIGISTQKLHARGPIGLDKLTTNKFVIRGNGQIR